MGSEAKEAALVRAALGEMRRSAGLPVSFAGLVSATRTQVEITQLMGAATTALDGLVIGAGSGLGGRAILSGRVLWANDYLADPRITHEYDQAVAHEGLRAIAVAPIIVDRSVGGLLYGGTRGSLPLGDRTLDAVNRAAYRLSFEFAVRREVTRRIVAYETDALLAAARQVAAPSAERVREVRADLRALYLEVDDPILRERIRRASDSLAGAQGSPGVRNPLAPREVDVLALVAEGCGNAEIAHRLELELETVKAYLRNAARRMGTHSRTESLAVARRCGFLP